MGGILKKRNKNLLYHYAVSYMGVALTALSLFLFLSLWNAAEAMEREEVRILQNRMHMAANDLEEQLETMRTITLNVASRAEFRKDTLKKGKYREIEMLNSLKNYNWTTVISDFFFLRYEGEKNIFTSQGETVLFEVYCQNKIMPEEYENVRAALENAAQDKTIPYLLAKTGNGSVLVIYPLKKYAASSIGMDGVLCFEVKEKLLEKRMEQMAGKLPEDMEIYYDDFRLFSRHGDGENNNLTGETVSGRGRIRIVYDPDKTGYFGWNTLCSPGKGVILAGMILLLLGIALVAAWKSYVPIQKLVQKYDIRPDVIGDNELDKIDATIAAMIQRKEDDGRVLQKQYQLLRAHVLGMIATQEYSPMLQSRMAMLHIRMDGAVFGKLICDFDNVHTQEGNGELELLAEELADEGVCVYAFWTTEKQMTVLVSAEEEYQIGDVEEALGSLFEVRGFGADVTSLGICRDLGRLHTLSGTKEAAAGGKNFALPKKMASEYEFAEGQIAGDGGLEDFRNQSAMAVRAVKYIDENYTRYDLSLDMVAGELHITSPYLSRLIKQQIGMNYKEYLTRLRMTEAKKLLQDKNASIAEVCQRTGYSNVSHFIKTFQKYEGTTPAKYRDVR